MLENIVGSLLRYQVIQTTVQKAKAAKRLADHVITLGKKDSLTSRRQVFSYLQDHELTSKIFKEVAPRFKSRNGGYTRILHLQKRKGDGAQMALLELTEKELKVKEPKRPEAKPKAETTKPAAKPEAPAHPKHGAEPKQEKPKGGFFKNLGKFFRNKGGG